MIFISQHSLWTLISLVHKEICMEAFATQRNPLGIMDNVIPNHTLSIYTNVSLKPSDGLTAVGTDGVSMRVGCILQTAVKNKSWPTAAHICTWVSVVYTMLAS